MAARSSSASRTILVTGGTGTLGRELVARLARDRSGTIVVLTRSSSGTSDSAGVRAVTGDVRAGATLGLTPGVRAELAESVTNILHCAAETTFNRPLEEARATNVDGTRAVLELARDCTRLERMVCFSTVYVAGRATGCFGEHDVAGRDGFVNTYEASKAEMEALVRDAMSTLPVALYRLSTIIGHSTTGEVTGYNAVHHALRLLYQGLAPMVPGRDASRVDLIPVDFAADAAYHLFEHAFTPGATYHVCAGAESSATLGSLLDATMLAFERYRPAWRKRSIARPALVELDTYDLFVRTVEEAGNEVLLQATRAVQAFAYQLAFPKVFDARHANAVLAPAGITAPPVLDYFDRVVRSCIESNWGAAA
ncbi:MAG TPA: SDR family oxidoreductase [Gemmatimonadaceae bacterium]|nr:SDR family oxidoreductase [Gemmatimonadaceae bacterium]